MRNPSRRSARSSRWQAAGVVLRSHLAHLPAPEALPPPRLGRRGRRLASSLAALFLLLACLASCIGRGASQPQPGPGPATPGVTEPSGTAGATPGALGSAQQQAAAFLAAYFSWDARDTDATYAARWQPYVDAAALPQFITAEPLLTLDGGQDVAARSPAPTIPTQAATGQGRQVQVMGAWTIQVLPAGGEGATWQPRQVQAMLTLDLEASGWQVSQLAWAEGGNP